MIDQFDSDETIVALATAREPGFSNGIVRLSGMGTREILERSFLSQGQRTLNDCRLPTQLSGEFNCNDLAAPIPVTLLYWPNRRSYTGQASAEIHAPGSLPLLDAIIHQVCENGARLAKPGEFTMRAFLGGRIDLTKAEAVLGVIDAKDQKHLDVALKQLAGGLSRPIHQSRQELLHTLAHLEAGLDFVEEDIEFVTTDEMLNQVSKCYADLQQLEKQLASRDQLDADIRLVLFGQPNTGKSSLFNELVDRFGVANQTAIVSTVSGTTRDFVACPLRVHGKGMVLVDTAGVEDQYGNVDGLSELAESPLGIGQEQSLVQRQQSALTILCLDSSQPRSSWEREQLEALDSETIVCLTKSDLVQNSPDSDFQFCVSSKSGEGIDELALEILRLAEDSEPAETIPSTSTRCRLAVDKALTSLEIARQLILNSAGEEVVACEIRNALDAIGTITGVVYTDDILDVVFSQFCIGK